MRDRSTSSVGTRNPLAFLWSQRQRAASAEEVFRQRFDASFDLVHGVLRAHCDAETAAAHTRAILHEHLDVLAVKNGPALRPDEMRRLLDAARRRARATR